MLQLRELNTGNDPRGLAILLSALKVWNYGHDPRVAITFEDALQELKETVNNSGPGIFVSLIREQLLLNTHRVVIELYPSSTVEEETVAVRIDSHLTCLRTLNTVCHCTVLTTYVTGGE